MIETNVVRDAVNTRLVELWPDRTCYVDVCPVDFDRPSCWIRVTRDERERANRCFTHRKMELAVTLYDEQDDHYESSWSRLARDADQLLNQLARPLSVGSRILLTRTKALPRDPDRVVVTVGLDFMDSLPVAPEETAPLMEHLETTVAAQS